MVIKKAANDSKISLEKTSPAFQEVYRNNPYCLLGISASSTRKEALDAAEKMKRYSNLGISSSYHPEYELKFIDASEYDINHILTRLSEIDNIESRFLWFSNPETLDELLNPDILNRLDISEILKKTVEEKNPDYDVTYNDYLGAIYHCMITDSEYQDENKWYDLFSTLITFLTPNEAQSFNRRKCPLLKTQIPESIFSKYHYKMIENLFHETIFKLFENNISHQDLKSLNRLLSIIDDSLLHRCIPTNVGFNIGSRLRRKIADIVLLSVRNAMDKIDSIIEMTQNDQDYGHFWFIPNELIEQLSIFENSIGSSTIFNLIKRLDCFEQYATLLLERYVTTIDEAAGMLGYCGQLKLAGKYYSYLYHYLDNSEISLIIDSWSEIEDEPSLEYLKFPVKLFSVEDCYYEGLKWQTINPRIYFKWILRAANKGHVDAMLLVRNAYANGFGVKQSDKETFYWTKKVADSGNPEVAFDLGLRYWNGKITVDSDEERKETAKKYWIMSYFGDNTFSVYSKHSEIFLNRYFPTWKTESIPMIKKFAEENNIELLQYLEEKGLTYASYYLGIYYYKQSQNEKDPFVKYSNMCNAELCLSKAKKQGVSDADRYLDLLKPNLARSYININNRNNVEKDEDEEETFYENNPVMLGLIHDLKSRK